MDVLDFFKQGLDVNNLSGLKGGPFDNAFEVFNNDPIQNNLILLGTNGNMTDEKNTNWGWLQKKAQKPKESSLIDSFWGNNEKSQLQRELMKVPDVLNECFSSNNEFSINRTILTNGLLIASKGVSDISNQFDQIEEEYRCEFVTLKKLKEASMNFFHNYTLKCAKPKVIFAYGNAKSGHSAWKYLRDYYKEKGSFKPIPKNGNTSYKFCKININGEDVIIIGSPHPCYAYNRLDTDLIKEGLVALKAL